MTFLLSFSVFQSTRHWQLFLPSLSVFNNTALTFSRRFLTAQATFQSHCRPCSVHNGTAYVFLRTCWFCRANYSTTAAQSSCNTALYRSANKSLARPTSWYILFDGENISFDASLVKRVYINSINIPPIMIINRIYETHLEHGFVWCWNLDASGSRSEIPGKFWNVVLEKDGKDQMDRSCEKWRRVT